MNKKILHTLLAIFLLMGISYQAMAQVTIGAGTKPSAFSVLELSTASTKGGLRLPHLSTTERDALSFANLPSGTPEEIATKANAVGLSIYNTDTMCVEYWNATKWVSLCTGQANISFVDEDGNPVDPTNPSFPPDGDEQGTYTPKDEPNCSGKIPPYNFMVITGSDYTRITVINNASGEFTITMDPNLTARSRMAIIRVTNNCTAEYSEFLFTQEGDAMVCKPGSKPLIEVSNGGKICNGGSVYMHISNVEAVPYVWTLNDTELTEAAGKSYHWATQPGTYRVYIGGVGCDTNASDRVVTKMDTGSAGESVGLVIATNNGIICGAGNTVTLTALSIPATGTLTWYKNGQADLSKTAKSITLGAGDVGDWFAVMTDGVCTSKASNVISVKSEPISTSLPNPDVYVNNKPLATANFCKNGYLTLKLNNIAVYNAMNIGVTIKWYNGSSLLGEGEELTIVVPNSPEFLLRCVVSDNTGANCTAEAINSKTMTGVAPSRPGVLGTPFICGSREANLTANGGQVGYSYQWFKAGSEIIGATTVNYSADQPGIYQVQMSDAGGCLSPMSATTEVRTSDLSILQLVNPAIQVEANSTHTYQVMGSHDPTEYSWSIAGEGVLIDAGTLGNTMRVKYNNVLSPLTATLSIITKNACGNSQTLTQIINVASACTPIANISTTISHTGDVLKGATITMDASAVGSQPMTYQWYKGGVPIGSPSFNSLYTISGAQASQSGEYSVTITNDCTTDINTVVGTIKVIDVDNTAVGSGTMNGETCYDLALSNDVATWGLLVDRMQWQADFATEKTYTFTNNGTANKNLRFVVQDPLGIVTSQRLGANIPSDASTILQNGGNYTINLQFDKAKVESLGLATTDSDGLQVRIIALFDAGAVTNKAEITFQIRDAQCCGTKSVPARILIGNNVYLTHRYNNDCWMVSNSKEGAYTYTTYSGQAAGARGYYYHYTNAATACINGWSLPTVGQYGGISGFINTGTIDTAKAYWTAAGSSARQAGGYDPVSGWHSWGATSWYWTTHSNNVYIGSSKDGMWGTAPTVHFMVVRCIKVGN